MANRTETLTSRTPATPASATWPATAVPPRPGCPKSAVHSSTPSRPPPAKPTGQAGSLPTSAGSPAHRERAVTSAPSKSRPRHNRPRLPWPRRRRSPADGSRGARENRRYCLFLAGRLLEAPHRPRVEGKGAPNARRERRQMRAARRAMSARRAQLNGSDQLEYDLALSVVTAFSCPVKSRAHRGGGQRIRRLSWVEGGGGQLGRPAEVGVREVEVLEQPLRR